MLDTKRYTVTEFFEFIKQPENTARHYELIAGEVVLVVSNGYASRVAARIVRFLDAFVEEHKLGRVTTADGGYMVGGQPYIPDAAFLSYKTQQSPEYTEGYNITAPDLAVEVLSPGNTETQITTKVVNYLNAGSLVWLVDPVRKTVTVYQSGQAPESLSQEDTLTGRDVLPGFTILVARLFPPE